MDQETRSLLCDAINAISLLKAGFGAPGDYGYDTPEGKALYTLYLLQADIVNFLQEQDADAAAPEGGAA